MNSIDKILVSRKFQIRGPVVQTFSSTVISKYWEMVGMYMVLETGYKKQPNCKYTVGNVDTLGECLTKMHEAELEP